MEDLGSIPGLRRFPGEGKGYPLQYSGLDNSRDCKVQGVSESDRTDQLSLSLSLWTVAQQAPLSMEFSWQEYWSGFSFPSPGDLPDARIDPGSPEASALQADSSLLSHYA